MAITPRGTILLTFAAFGAIVGSNVGAFPIIVKNAEVPLWLFGLVGSIGMLSNIFAMSLGGFINRYADHRTVLLIVLPLSFVALCFAQLAYSPFTFVVSAILISLALGACDLFMNAEGAAVEQETGKPIFSSYHGSASLAIAGFAILSSMISVWLSPWFVVLFTAVPVSLAFAAVYKTIPARGVVRHDEQKTRVVLPYRLLTFIGLAAGFNVTSEVVCIVWAGQLLTSIAPEWAAYSGLGVAFYGVCSGTMRLFGDGLRARFGDRNVMLSCLAVAIPGFMVLSLAPGFLISVIAFACVGFGLAVVFPCLFSLAAKLVPEGKAAAMGYVGLVGGLPRVTLPFLMGWLAQTYSLGAVFAASAVVSTTALVIIVATFARAEAALSER